MRVFYPCTLYLRFRMRKTVPHGSSNRLHAVFSTYCTRTVRLLDCTEEQNAWAQVWATWTRKVAGTLSTLLNCHPPHHQSPSSMREGVATSPAPSIVLGVVRHTAFKTRGLSENLNLPSRSVHREHLLFDPPGACAGLFSTQLRTKELNAPSHIVAVKLLAVV